MLVKYYQKPSIQLQVPQHVCQFDQPMIDMHLNGTGTMSFDILMNGPNGIDTKTIRTRDDVFQWVLDAPSPGIVHISVTELHDQFYSVPVDVTMSFEIHPQPQLDLPRHAKQCLGTYHLPSPYELQYTVQSKTLNEYTTQGIKFDLDHSGQYHVHLTSIKTAYCTVPQHQKMIVDVMPSPKLTMPDVLCTGSCLLYTSPSPRD